MARKALIRTDGEIVPPSTEEPEGRKVQQVLEAAKQVFIEQGFGSASMDAIARAANVSKATLYAYYPSKEVLFGAAVGSECLRHRMAFETIEAEHLSVEEGLLRFATHFVRFLLGPKVQAVFRLVVSEVPRSPQLAQIFYDAGPKIVHDRTVEYLAAAHQRGELSVPDANLAAEMFLGMVKGRVFPRGLLFDVVDEAALDRYIHEAVRVFLRAYAPPETPSP